MKSLFNVSSFLVRRTYETLTILYLTFFISFLSNSNVPATHSVRTLRVPNISVFFAIFVLLLPFLLADFPLVSSWSLPRSLSRELEPCFTGRRPSRHVFPLSVSLVGFYHLFLFPSSGISAPFCSTVHTGE